MKVALLTMFENLKPTYSLVYVVSMQVQMLLEAGYKVKLLVSERCEEGQKTGILTDSRIEWVKVREMNDSGLLQGTDYYDEKNSLPDNLEEQISVIKEALIDYLKEDDLCFLHDILFQSKHYIHHLAVRAVQEALPQLRFIAFTHSYPFNRPAVITERIRGRYTPLPHTLYAYPTRSGIKALASQYNVPEGLCHVVYHPLKVVEQMSEAVKKLHYHTDLLRSDLLIIYPARLTVGKQLEKVAQLAGALCTLGNLRVKVIYCDFEAKDTEPSSYKKRIKEKGEQYGLSEEDIVFTSECGYESGFPHEGVMELFELSNVYVGPSKSESFGLTVLEAAQKGNFLVLNENVPALKELGKELKAYFMKWDARVMGHDICQNYEGEEATYYGFHARQILAQLRTDSLFIAKTKVRKRFSSQWIWENQMKPLIEEVMSRKGRTQNKDVE